jgi:hypothetical protein
MSFYSALYNHRRKSIAIQPRNKIHPIVAAAIQAIKPVVASSRIALRRAGIACLGLWAIASTLLSVIDIFLCVSFDDLGSIDDTVVMARFGSRPTANERRRQPNLPLFRRN